jgi:hypothetical protein
MGSSPPTIGLAIVAAVLAAGCSSSPWPTRTLVPRWPPDGSAASPTGGAPLVHASGPQGPGNTAATQPDAGAMQQVMAELQDLGALDPAGQARLMADLRQTDPVWWPMVVQQFRAALAYRRRAERGLGWASHPGQPPAGSETGHDWPVRTVAATVSAEEATAGATHGLAIPATGQPVAGRGGAREGPAVAATRATPGDGQRSQGLARLPGANDAALAPAKAPQGDYPATSYPAAVHQLASRPTDLPQDAGAAEETNEGSGNRATSADWQAELSDAIRTLETQLQGAPATADEAAQQARLRMLYLLAGRRDDALQAIPSIPPADQEFWSKQLYGLATWLDTQRTADGPHRAAEAKRILEEAISRLGESAPLVVRNLAFCTDIQSYGCTKRFRTYEFSPDQEVLLYAEVENFASEATPKGFHTSLRSSYQIFDSRGQRVADHQFTTTPDYCQNPRRDFFIGYHLRLPQRIYPGKHTLQLTIEDLESHKVGQSSIELTIKDAGK